jgi:aminoglycoside 3-N-acetyltransferase
MALRKSTIEEALRALDLGNREVLFHSSLSALGHVERGAPAVVEALTAVCSTVLMAAFTYECEVWNERGVLPGNAYYERPAAGRVPTTFRRDTPVSRAIGVIPETLRTWPGARRSSHPTQSFIAVGVASAELVDVDDGAYPIGPIRRLLERDGTLLLLGVSHTSSTAIHLAEHLEGRAPFVRYAHTPAGVVEIEACGCSDAFDDLEAHVEGIERSAGLGAGRLRAYPLPPYAEAARSMLRADANALLCGQCARCRARWVD